MAKLGEPYQPALQALKERRDEAERSILSSTEPNSIVEFVALNKSLRETERNIALLNQLKLMGEKIKSIEWSYSFYADQSSQVAVKSYKKKSNVELSSNEHAFLFMQVGIGKGLEGKTQRVQINRIEYLDGTVWLNNM